MRGSAHKTLWIVAGVSLSFTGIVVLILFLMARRVITYQMAMLMFVALLGLYFGFGVLIAVYRLISKLD